MLRLKVGVAAVVAAAVIGVAGRAHAQATPGPRRTAPAAPSDPSDTWDKYLALGLELGPGGVLSSYNAQDSPSALLFYGALRANIDIKESWSGGVTRRTFDANRDREHGDRRGNDWRWGAAAHDHLARDWRPAGRWRRHWIDPVGQRLGRRAEAAWEQAG